MRANASACHRPSFAQVARSRQATLPEVARDQPLSYPEGDPMPQANTSLDAFPTSTPRWNSSVIRDLLEHAKRPGVISLAGGLPADEALPTERLAACSAAMFERAGAESLQYGSTAGEAPLREILASFEAVHPDDLVVTTGSQQALDLVVRTLTRPGDHAVVDAPGYVGAIQVLRGNELALHGCPVDGLGLNTEALEGLLVGGLRPRLVYTNPQHQNPTGGCLSAERARHLEALADRFDFWIVADDPYREITFDRAAPSPEDGLHPGTSGRVILLGSLSKTLSPGLRIGWCSGPTQAMRSIVIAKQSTDLHTSTLNQLIAASALSDHRWWVQHLQSLRSLYRSRHDALGSAIATHLPEATAQPVAGGFFSWIDLPGADTTALLSSALEVGVAYVPGSAFLTDDRPSNALRLAHSFADVEDFNEGLRRLAAAVATSRNGPLAQR